MPRLRRPTLRKVERSVRRWWRWVIATVLLGSALAAVGRLAAWRGREDPEALLDRARAEAAAGRHDRADALLQRRARSAPPRGADWLLRAELAEARARPDEALGALGRIQDGDPLAPRARFLAGALELRRDRARAAESAFRRAADLDPKLFEAHRELASLAAQRLRPRECDAEFAALEGLTALDARFVFLWSQVLCSIWDPEEVRGRMSRFVRADPEDAASRRALAESLRRLKRPVEAEAELRRLPDSDPQARAARGVLALERGDRAAAESLTSGGPADHPVLARLRGRLAQLRGDGPAAVRHFRAAVASDPEDRDALFGLGQALAAAGDREAARPYVLAAHRHDVLRDLIHAGTMRPQQVPRDFDDPALFRKLGLACEAIGNRPLARAWFRLAIARDPLDAEAQQALFRLRQPAPRAVPPR